MTVTNSKDELPMCPYYNSPTKRLATYVRNHKVSLGVFLAAYGAFYLTAVIMGGWTLSDWGKSLFAAPPSTVHSLIASSYISPIFFLTSLPALLIGATILSAIGIQRLRSHSAVDEHIAVALVAFGFAYQIVGAWPLQSIVDMPWEWQKQIMSFGSLFAWMLYVVSWVVLGVGAASLYVHSRIYRMKHSELSLN